MRLNWFWPSPQHPSPRAAFVRRVVGALGPSWALSPLRRVVQAVSLMVFLFLLLYVCSPGGARHHAQAMRAREVLPAETFLALDPLVSVSTALAARAWVWPLLWAAALIVVALQIIRHYRPLRVNKQR